MRDEERSSIESRGTAVLEFTNVTIEAVGPDHGLGQADLRALAPRLEDVVQELQRTRQHGRPEFLDLPNRLDLIEQVRSAQPTLDGMDAMVVLGIGGSALGPRAILDAAWGPNHLTSAGAPGGPDRRVYVADNIDPDGFLQILDSVDPRSTLFNVISKSGSTVETMAQLAVVWKRLGEALGPDERRRRFVFTTDPQSGFLRDMANSEGIVSLEIPSGVGGRFSVLTAVGLFPALASGIAPETLLEGAAEMDNRCRNPRFWENPAAVLAAVHYLTDRKRGKTIAVLMPYSDRLRTFADWFCQLWAESLGKAQSRGGEGISPSGQTPVRAVGTTDQHSQLQLFLEGPNDKLITLVLVERSERDTMLESPGITDTGLPLEYLRGHSLGDVFKTEQVATEMALARAERPTLVWRLPSAGAHVLGQMFYVYEVACALAGELYYVNPYDQPAVEEGKELTYGALGREGFADKGDDVARYRERGHGYRV